MRQRPLLFAFGAGATGAAAAGVLAVRARRGWERELSTEELVQLPDAEPRRITRPDGAEISVFVAGEATGNGDGAGSTF
ncbi:MAG: hypothetical protein ACRDV4_10900, partial [Acidimicrobiales bacterium]